MKKKKRVFKQEKLWRDKTPQIHQDRGSIIHCKSLTDAEYDKQLRLKLVEEAQEVEQAELRDHIIEEIADVFEVLDAFMELHNIEKDQVVRVQKEKRELRGGFYERMYVIKAVHERGSIAEQYCLAESEKYPIIEE